MIGRRTIGFFSVAAVAIVLILLARQGWFTEKLLSLLKGPMGPWGPVVFGVIDAAPVVLMAPTSMLTIAGGAMFNPVLRTVTVS